MRMTFVLFLVILVGCTSNLSECHPKSVTARKSRSDKVTRIIEGTDAKIEDFPWQAVLYDKGASDFHCGAVVVNNTVAITAAHCVQEDMTYTIRVGSAFKNGTAHDTSKVIINPDYEIGPGAFPNDIAVLTFDTSLIDENVEIAKMPGKDEDFSDRMCKISGFGRNENQLLPAQLQEATIRVMSNSECENESNWGDSINDGHVCVTSETSGACNGDSGGPLTCDGTIVGVTSWGLVGCSVSKPSVYSKITYFKDFIDPFLEY